MYTRIRSFSLLIATSLFLTACAAEPDAPGADEFFDDPDLAAAGKEDGSGVALSSVGLAVVDALNATAPGEYGRTWTISSTNRLDADWIVQSPPRAHWGAPAAAIAMPALCTSGSNCDLDFGLRTCAVDTDCGASGSCVALAATRRSPSDSARKLCVGHSDAELLDRIHGLITSARTTVDLTSLSPPDGRFEAALRNAVTYLARDRRAVTLRFLFGAFPVAGEVDAAKVLAGLTRDLPADAPVTVFVGNYRSSNLPPSWNHSKIIAVDGQTALVGGHNLWTRHYLDEQPVHDLSMKVSGPAAVHGHRFADAQWRWTCANRTWITRITKSVAARRWRTGRVDETCPGNAYLASAPPIDGDVTVIGAGRLSWVDAEDDANQSDTAQLAMIEEAHTSIRLSQQDIGPPKVPVLGIPTGSWPTETLEALAAAIARGVDVKIVVSSPDSSVGGLGSTEGGGYANGWTLADIAVRIRAQMANVPGAPTGAALDALLCEKLHIAPLRFGPDDGWVGGSPPGNHAKLILVDDTTFHIGSQNVYPAGLTELGYIVDSATASAQLLANYWDPLWTHSSRHAIAGGTSCP